MVIGVKLLMKIKEHGKICSRFQFGSSVMLIL